MRRTFLLSNNDDDDDDDDNDDDDGGGVDDSGGFFFVGRARGDTRPAATTNDPAPKSIKPYPVTSVLANRRGNK